MFPYPAHLPILIDATGRVFLGGSMLRSGRRRLPVMSVETTQAQGRALLEMDAEAKPLPSVRARCAYVLRQIGLPLEWLRDLLQCVDLATASRWARLMDLPASVLLAMDGGTLSLGHARQLFGLPSDLVDSLVAQTIRLRWTVAQLRRAIQNPGPTVSAPTSADIQNYAEMLSTALGAPVSIHW